MTCYSVAYWDGMFSLGRPKTCPNGFAGGFALYVPRLFSCAMNAMVPAERSTYFRMIFSTCSSSHPMIRNDALGDVRDVEAGRRRAPQIMKMQIGEAGRVLQNREGATHGRSQQPRTKSQRHKLDESNPHRPIRIRS